MRVSKRYVIATLSPMAKHANDNLSTLQFCKNISEKVLGDGLPKQVISFSNTGSATANISAAAANMLLGGGAGGGNAGSPLLSPQLRAMAAQLGSLSAADVRELQEQLQLNGNASGVDYQFQ